MQAEITRPGPLLDDSGRLAQVGWSRFPLLDCNLEKVSFYPPFLRPLQRLRVKRWDYYAVFTPARFFSATIADLGYAGNIFLYTLDWATGELREQTLVVPPGKAISLPRNSGEGEALFDNGRVRLCFRAEAGARKLSVAWPNFRGDQGIEAEIALSCPPQHESMVITIPIGRKRFYYNRKTNCMPAEGWIKYGNRTEELRPGDSIGSLDWGRGVWEYRSFWNWASASGFLPDGRAVGLNLGCGFGDTSAATENCVVLDGCVHKLDQVAFQYDPADYMQPWHFTSPDGQLDLTFVPFKERVATTSLGVITSVVHQMFGRYSGEVRASGDAGTGDGKTLRLRDLVGFAEEHHARW